MSFNLSSTEMGLLSKSIFFKVTLCEIHVVLKGSSGGSTESQRGTPLHTHAQACRWRGGCRLQARIEKENWVTSGEDSAK